MDEISTTPVFVVDARVLSPRVLLSTARTPTGGERERNAFVVHHDLRKRHRNNRVRLILRKAVLWEEEAPHVGDSDELIQLVTVLFHGDPSRRSLLP